ncbi:hypothetical protein QQ045_029275 [Rhodiola kirilowii]
MSGHDSVSTSLVFSDFNTNAFEVQIDIGRLKSIQIEKMNDEDWRFWDTDRFRLGWAESSEHIGMDMEFFFHSYNGGRLLRQENISGHSHEDIISGSLRCVLCCLNSKGSLSRMKTRQSTFDHASGSLQFIKMMVQARPRELKRRDYTSEV